MSQFPTEPIANVSPYPRIDLWGPKPVEPGPGMTNAEIACETLRNIGRRLEQDRIWRAVVATAESSNVEAGQ